MSSFGILVYQYTISRHFHKNCQLKNQTFWILLILTQRLRRISSPQKRCKTWRKVQTWKAHILVWNLAQSGFAKQNAHWKSPRDIREKKVKADDTHDCPLPRQARAGKTSQAPCLKSKRLKFQSQYRRFQIKITDCAVGELITKRQANLRGNRIGKQGR